MEHYGSKINCLSNRIKREIENLESIQSLEMISGVNGFILVYIYKNHEHDVFQKDIEHEFGITRSTASKVISLMEKKNLIIRESVSDDARMKKLTLTDLAKSLAMSVERDLDAFEKRLMNGLNENDKNELTRILDKLEENLCGGKNND